MDCWISTILTLIVAGLFIIWYYSKQEDYFKKRGIPIETPIPLFGNMMKPILRITPFMERICQFYYINTEAKYVGYYDFSSPVIMLRDPEIVKSIVIKNFDHFVDHRGFVDPVADPLFGKNLFSLRGDNWREIRNLLSPAFTSSKMKSMFKLMSKCSESFTDYMMEQFEKQKSLTINSKDAFTRYTNDVIATCAFGVSVDSMRNPDNTFYVLGRKTTNFEGILSLKFQLIRNFPTLSNLLRVKLIDERAERFFNGLVRDTIAYRDEKGITRPDMIQLMMETRNDRNGQKPELTIQDMTSQAFIFFFGGFDTSSTFMCFLAHSISANPEVQTKLQNEIDEVYDKYHVEPTYEAINSMQYLDAVLNETLRLYPIAGFLDRVCTKSIELPPPLPGMKPLHLQPGDNIIIPTCAFQSDPQYYPDPKKFSPERFLEDSKAILNSSTYLPFGDGPRICIGNRFALLETKILIYHLMAKFTLIPGEKMVLPLKLSAASLIVWPVGGFWLDLQPRRK
nr:cytochrome P450 4AV17 [Meteorus pulchricornis]